MNIHHTKKTTLLAFLGFMCLTTELEAKFNPLKYINPAKIVLASVFASLIRLHSKESITNFTEARVERYEKADFYMKPLCYIDDWIIGQLESSNLLKVTDKNYIKFSCKDSADAAGLLGILESCIEPYGDAAKNFLFIAVALRILFDRNRSLFKQKDIRALIRIIENDIIPHKNLNSDDNEAYKNAFDYPDNHHRQYVEQY